MVTITTERGTTDENGKVVGKFDFMTMLAVSLGTGLLLSLIASYNLSNDVTDLTQNKVPELQKQIAADRQALMQAAKPQSNAM
jgi:hypothetical protein